ncbi:MAG: S8 family serine peptidase, partial [Bacteroidetes bacterium]|nr:S8 family serine peptidase [Bacteroidota bacterium]
ITYDSDVSPVAAAALFSGVPEVEYAEPHFLQKLCYVPDDPLDTVCYHYDTIKAFEAYDISTGDASIIIGITDTGIEFGHEDLDDNLAVNYSDPVNGIDDDNDGFTDNYNGWDLGQNDRNPSWDPGDWNTELLKESPHGIWVSGMASAVPDNGKGVTGTGYHCKFLPVKISRIDPADPESVIIEYGYEGIVYAADHGCSVINCSWGNTYWSRYEQDIVNYAAVNRNALVVAAAGNDGNTSLFYPASYNNVLSIACTKQGDEIYHGSWGGSNYNDAVDMSAPGAYIEVPTYNNDYKLSGWGTSYSSAVVAGCAGIVKARFPDFGPEQIAAQLVVTADSIDTIPANETYAGKIGSGRVNLYRAVTETSRPWVRFEDYTFTGPLNGIPQQSDTVLLTGTFTNYLWNATNLTAALQSLSPYVSVISGAIVIGNLGQMGSYDNTTDPFSIKISDNCPFIYTADFVMTITGNNGYSSATDLTCTLNVPVIDVDTNNIATSVTTNGRIGYSTYSQDHGNGFCYKNLSSFLYNGGIMYGNDYSNVADCYGASTNFIPLTHPVKDNSLNISDLDITGHFTENIIGLIVTQYAYAWNNPADEDYIIIEYLFNNPSEDSVSNLYAGICADWDIIDPYSNHINYNEDQKMSYIYYTENGVHTGVKLLSSGTPKHYAVDNVPGGADGFDIVDNFTSTEKFLVLSNNRHIAGAIGNGNDVVDVMSSGPFTILSGDSLKIAFALICGDNLMDMLFNGIAAQSRYDSIYEISVEERDLPDYTCKIHPNPFSGNTELSVTLPASARVEITLYNSAWKYVRTISSGKVSAGESSYVISGNDLTSGVHYVLIDIDGRRFIRKVVVCR